MKIRSVDIQNFRAIGHLALPLDPKLTALHGVNGHGKTSVLGAIALGLGAATRFLTGSAGVAFRQSDLRHGALSASVTIQTVAGWGWSRQFTAAPEKEAGFTTDNVSGGKELRDHLGPLLEAAKAQYSPGAGSEPPTDLPLFAFYDTDRAVFDLPLRRRNFATEFNRFAAFDDALSAKTSFKALFEWFHARENEELRLQRGQMSFEASIKDLDAVRRAIESMMPGVTDPHIEVHPLRFLVTLNRPPQPPQTLSLSQLSGGYRIMIALVADLARRMALANPHLDDPLQSEAIALIDEVELHLHPEWQQRVLEDLTRTFPNTQFIVSTHSPQVLTTVRPEQIVHMESAADGVAAYSEAGPTYGAEAGDVLSATMRVAERPPANAFTETLDAYRTMVRQGQGETDRARGLRRRLEELSPHDKALAAADVEIRRQAVMRDLQARR